MADLDIELVVAAKQDEGARLLEANHAGANQAFMTDNMCGGLLYRSDVALRF